MKINLIAISTKMPNWINQGFAEYQKRLPREFELNLIEISAEKRLKTSNLANIASKEASKVLQYIKTSTHCVTLDENGKQHSTKSFSQRLQHWQQLGSDIAIIIGGPEGLAQECRQRANETISLSALTFPHPLVRVILAEQLYRAVSLLQNHPYHRE